MPQPWEKLAKELKNSNFIESFLDAYIRNGYGALPKREIDLLIVKLLLENVPTWTKDQPTSYVLSRALRLSPRRVQTMLDEIAYRDEKKDDSWCKEQLIEIIKRAEKIKRGEFVRFQIDDGLIRDYATDLIRSSYGIVDTSFNTSIIKLSGEQLSSLVLQIIDDQDRKKILDSIDKKKKELHQDTGKTKSAIRLFIDSFAEQAGKQAGKKTVNLGFTMLTGGVSDAIDLINKLIGGDD